MGAWGHKSFQNDDALDWAGALEHKGFSMIAAAFAAISSDYVEAPKACKAIAAAEVVAAMKGNPADKIPQSVANFLKGKPQLTPQLVDRARAVLDQILESSELKELWEEGDSNEWTADIEGLMSRLS